MKNNLLIFGLASIMFACTQTDKSEQKTDSNTKVEKLAPKLAFKEVKKQPDDGFSLISMYFYNREKKKSQWLKSTIVQIFPRQIIHNMRFL